MITLKYGYQTENLTNKLFIKMISEILMGKINQLASNFYAIVLVFIFGNPAYKQ
jgi:hypothetical protein